MRSPQVITAFSTTIFSIMDLFSTISINDTQHNNTLQWVSLCWVSFWRLSHFIYCYAECHNAECHCAECRYAECRGAPQVDLIKLFRVNFVIWTILLTYTNILPVKLKYLAYKKVWFKFTPKKFHTTSISSWPKNGLRKVECWITLGWLDLPRTKILAHWAHF
jgi:hypothetical protein